MEKLSQRVIVSDEQPLTTDIQYLESFTSSALNRKFSGMVHKGVFRGFECEAMAGKHVLVSSKDITGVALVERDDYVLTVRQNDDVLVDLGDIQDGHLVLEAFYQYGVTTKQVDAKSKVDAALIKFVEVGKQADHHTILCRVTIPPEAADVAAEHISYIERDYGGADIAQHVNTPDPHQQYLLRNERATNQEIDQRSNLLRHILLPELWRALDNALRNVEIEPDAVLTSDGNALNGITIGIKTATLQQKGVIQLDGQYSSNSDELAATTAAVHRAVNHVLNTCLDKNATAVAAHKLEQAFNLALTGDVTGNVDIDGDSNVSINVTIEDDSHAHTIENVDGLADQFDTKLNKNTEVATEGALTGGAALDGGLTLGIKDASVNEKGAVQLSNAVNSDDESQASTLKATKTAHDRAIAAENAAKAYTDQLISQLLGDAPAEHLNTLKELGEALTDNDSDIAAINAELVKKVDKAIQIVVTGALTGGGTLGDNITLGIKDATTTQKGAVQLSTAVDSDSEVEAATSKGLKIAYDLAASKWTHQIATTAQSGTVQLSNATNSISEALAATPKAVNSVLQVANAKWTYKDGNLSQKGAVQLSSAVNSTSQALAATPKAVKIAYDLAASKWTHRAASTTQTGTVQLTNAVNSTSQTLAASAKAVKTAYDKANHSHPYAPKSHSHNFNQIDAGTSSGVFVASDFKGTSDRRLKTDIEPVGDMLGKLLGLKVYEYEKAGNREIGVMAQDLKELVPTLVGEGEDGYLSVSHFGLNACSIKAIQEQQQIIARQTQIIAEMAQRLSHLEETVNG